MSPTETPNRSAIAAPHTLGGWIVQRPWLLWLAAALTALVFFGLLRVALAPQLHHWDQRLASLSWQFADADQQERRVVVVDIDERSVQALGPWPWPRERVAELIARLDDKRVGLKVLDVVFEGEQAGDAALVRTLRNGAPSVLSQVLPILPEQHLASGQLAGAVSQTCPPAAVAGFGHLSPTPRLVAAAAGVGHITPSLDADGSIRQVPALICVDGQAYPALPLAALMAATQSPLTMESSSALTGPAARAQIGDFQIPLNVDGQIQVAYHIPRSGLISVSAVDVLRGQAADELLKGAWVVVGSTAFGAGDAVTTPQGRSVGGVEIHAQMLAAMLDERTPYTPQWAAYWPWATALVALLVFAGVSLFQRARAGWAIPLTALTLVAALWGAQSYLLLAQHLWLPWGSPALFVVVAASLFLIAEWLRVRAERERVFATLSTYLPEAAARQVAYAEPSAQVHASRQEAIVLSIDLRNFSAYCEGRTPEDAATVLHLFYSTVEAIVRAHGGEIEHMVGDGILAVWKDANASAEPAQHALRAADEIWQQVSAQLPQVSSRSTPAMDVGLGLEQGSVLVGSFGPARRRVHSVLGETVSVAVRLQEMAGELAYPILLGPKVASSLASEPRLIDLGAFLLPGLQSPRRVTALSVKMDHNRLHLVYGGEQSDPSESSRSARQQRVQ